jgi:hypothetical protein
MHNHGRRSASILQGINPMKLTVRELACASLMLALLYGLPVAPGAAQTNPAVQESKRPRICVVLSGGGAYHLFRVHLRAR